MTRGRKSASRLATCPAVRRLLLALGERLGSLPLAGTLPTEQHDRWAGGRRFFSLESVGQLNPELKSLPTDDRPPGLLPAARGMPSATLPLPYTTCQDVATIGAPCAEARDPSR